MAHSSDHSSPAAIVVPVRSQRETVSRAVSLSLCVCGVGGIECCCGAVQRGELVLPKCTILIYFTIPQLLINLAAPAHTHTHSRATNDQHICMAHAHTQCKREGERDIHMLVGLFVHRIWVGFACGRACNLNNEDILLIQEIQLARLEYEPHSHSYSHAHTH